MIWGDIYYWNEGYSSHVQGFQKFPYAEEINYVSWTSFPTISQFFWKKSAVKRLGPVAFLGLMLHIASLSSCPVTGLASIAVSWVVSLFCVNSFNFFFVSFKYSTLISSSLVYYHMVLCELLPALPISCHLQCKCSSLCFCSYDHRLCDGNGLCFDLPKYDPFYSAVLAIQSLRYHWLKILGG